MADSFIRRWSRRKTESVAQEDALRTEQARHAAHDGPDASPQEKAPSLPTMRDVQMLRADADFSPFMARGVDRQVRRAALKTLFSDPHFQVMDGLDIYIDDYNRPSPVSPEMLAALAHARSTLQPKPLYRVDEPAPERMTAEQEDVAAQHPEDAAAPHEDAEPEPSADPPAAAEDNVATDVRPTPEASSLQ